MITNNIAKLSNFYTSKNNNGFTITGLAYDLTNNYFLCGNIGKEHPTDSTPINSSIVVLDSSLNNVLFQIELAKNLQIKGDIQGVTIDSVNNSIWFCDFGENKVYNISYECDSITSFDVSKPTGIAYDCYRDMIWVLTYSNLLLYNRDGDLFRIIPTNEQGQDQLFYDSGSDALFMTAGNNYKGENYVFVVDCKTGEKELRFILKDSYAIEGITIVNGNMYIANDGYYHDAKSNINQINIYKNFDN